jgi:hypothetical protein
LSKKRAQAQRAAIAINTHESFSLIEVIKEALNEKV